MSLLQVGKAVVTDFRHEKVWIDLGEVPFPCFKQDACQNGGTVMFWMFTTIFKISSMASASATGIAMDIIEHMYAHFYLFS